VSEVDDRGAFRRFVLANHPDRGGDPETFLAGLARFRRGAVTGSAGASSTPPNVVFYKRVRGFKRLTGHWHRPHRTGRHRRPRVI
jgi:hypothetical protein